MATTAVSGSVQAPADPAGDRRPDRTGGTMTEIPTQRGAVRGDSSAPQVADRPPLPHRRPQQHLAPELREDGLPGQAPDAAPAAARSPEEARDRFTRYQRAWAAGRAAKNGDSASRDDQGRKA